MWSNNIKNVNLDGKYQEENHSESKIEEEMMIHYLYVELEDIQYDIDVLREELVDFVGSISMDADAVCSLAREIEEAEDKRLKILTKINELQQGSW